MGRVVRVRKYKRRIDGSVKDVRAHNRVIETGHWAVHRHKSFKKPVKGSSVVGKDHLHFKLLKKGAKVGVSFVVPKKRAPVKGESMFLPFVGSVGREWFDVERYGKFRRRADKLGFSSAVDAGRYELTDDNGLRLFSEGDTPRSQWDNKFFKFVRIRGSNGLLVGRGKL